MVMSKIDPDSSIEINVNEVKNYIITFTHTTEHTGEGYDLATTANYDNAVYLQNLVKNDCETQKLIEKHDDLKEAYEQFRTLLNLYWDGD